MSQAHRIFGTFAAAIVLITVASAQAANISWSKVLVDTTDGDSSPGAGLGDLAVSLNGDLLDAANFGTGTDITVNTVLFPGVGFNDTPYYTNQFDDSQGGASTSTGGNIDTLTSTFARRAGVSSNSGTLTGLTVGKYYEVQFISSYAGLNRTATYDDGNGNTIDAATNNPHSFVTGTFLADATAQAVDITASTGSTFLNAYQLRLVGVPDLRVDFNDDDSGVSPTQYGFFSVTQSGASNLATSIGTVDISFSSFGGAASNPDRDRGLVTGAPLVSDLGRDFIFGQAPTLDITISGVRAGIYDFTAFLHDNNVDQGTVDIDYSVDGGSTFLNGVIGDYTVGASTTELGSASFQLTADGLNDIVIRLDGSGANSLINGFTLLAKVPEPSSVLLAGVAGALLLALAAARRRRPE